MKVTTQITMREPSHHPLLDVTLSDGRGIFSKGIHVTHTYGRYLVCSPNSRLTQNHLAEIPQHLRRIFGDFPVHIIPPLLRRPAEPSDEFPWPPGIVEEHMPAFEMASLFYSVPTKNPDMHLSGLIVVWHQDFRHEIPDTEAKTKLPNIPWLELAIDFET